MHDRVISYLDNFGNTGFWQIVKNVGGSERRMIRLLNQMVLNNEITYNDDSFPTKNSKHNMNCICDKCNGKRVVTDKIQDI